MAPFVPIALLITSLGDMSGTRVVYPSAPALSRCRGRSSSVMCARKHKKKSIDDASSNSCSGNDICAKIRSSYRGERVIHCHLIENSRPPSSPTEDQKTLELLVPQFGLLYRKDDQYVRETFHQIKRDQALTVATKILQYDLAYSCLIMDYEAAHGLAKEFLYPFSNYEEKAHFFTNGDFYKEGLTFGWSPATLATFDTGIVMLGRSKAGCLWVEDED